MGLRLFVDGLLEIGDISDSERLALERQLSRNDNHSRRPNVQGLLTQASSLLAGLAGGAGLVLVKHVEFVNLSGEQALAVLVYSDGHIENRLMPYPQGMLPSSLEQAGNFLSARLRGRQLSEARTDILAEIEQGQAEIDKAAKKLIAQGLASWSVPENKRENRALIVRGQAQLLDNLQAQSDVERIQSLFRDLEQKEDLIALLDSTEDADGVKIFIGTENTLYSLTGSSVVMAPYRDAEKNIIGAVGVIGPTRLNYGRVIPVVDYTAQLIGRLLGDEKGARNG